MKTVTIKSSEQEPISKHLDEVNQLVMEALEENYFIISINTSFNQLEDYYFTLVTKSL